MQSSSLQPACGHCLPTTRNPRLDKHTRCSSLYYPHSFPAELKQQQLFNFSLSDPFKRGQGWLAWALIGISAAPLIVGATALAVTAVGYEQATSNSHGTADGVAGMLSLDWPTYIKLVSVTGRTLHRQVCTAGGSAQDTTSSLI